MKHEFIVFVYVIAREGVKFGINFTSCSEHGNEIARGAAECYFAVIATMSGIYPKIYSCLFYHNLILKSKCLIFKLTSTMSSGFLLLPASHDGSRLFFVCVGQSMTQYPAE